MTKIIDIIKHKNAYDTQTMIVVDEAPLFKYERKGDLLVGEDSGFFNFFVYEEPSKSFQAFAGREFDIPMKDGSVEKASGQWWDCFPEDYQELTYSLGVASIEQLENCYVFMSMKVDKEMVDTWLTENNPSNNYYKYDKRKQDYGKHTITSRWGNGQY